VVQQLVQTEQEQLQSQQLVQHYLLVQRQVTINLLLYRLVVQVPLVKYQGLYLFLVQQEDYQQRIQTLSSMLLLMKSLFLQEQKLLHWQMVVR
jgi:hypothetical protein